MLYIYTASDRRRLSILPLVDEFLRTAQAIAARPKASGGGKGVLLTLPDNCSSSKGVRTGTQRQNMEAEAMILTCSHGFLSSKGYLAIILSAIFI